MEKLFNSPPLLCGAQVRLLLLLLLLKVEVQSHVVLLMNAMHE